MLKYFYWMSKEFQFYKYLVFLHLFNNNYSYVKIYLLDFSVFFQSKHEVKYSLVAKP